MKGIVTSWTRAQINSYLQDISCVHHVREGGDADHMWILFYPSTWDWIPHKVQHEEHTNCQISSILFTNKIIDTAYNICESKPWPEFFTGTLWTFHTNNTRFPRHAKSW